MEKRTNNKNRISEYVFVSVLPIILVALTFIGGTENAIEKILYAGAYMSNPEMLFIREENTKTEVLNEMTLSDNIVNSNVLKVSSVPEDIMNLINEAEELYKNSTNDGKIIEKDCSTQNATSEYNGIYVKNSTISQKIDIAQQLEMPVYAVVDENEPSVLIYHTHTSETYELLDRGFYTKERSSRSENPKENMIRVGEEICKVLEKRGIKTIHDKTVYDEKYNGAYERSCEKISEILRQNPSIQVVLDVHRDAMYQKDGTRIKPVTEINGKKAAQIMILTGCEDGNVTNFPNWKKNLAFAVQLHNKVNSDNPKLLRPLMFCSRKYNMHLTPCSLLVEFGTDANTLAEAVYSAELFAESLSDFLEEYIIND